ncbi:putative phospholipid-binding lipoprotein MlaA precursor [Hydrogenophaga sp. T4]|uniref:VacJ family lipoprotein n=1 Tax=Hydrogenophaga aromaticivorans TaxID=2610898 RepID=A0A7Y8GTV4_9BURK|nr:VacJ family lipoprotein [Hydrogenophaga aromaticivorans]EWS65708.1 putative phospholipid-binding lipoprotein MlaA precursor [Hydrogenophaga sp. T4]NWF44103.1 VacJ family lipoprotein [Hydrogenophaga aromaticivorans]
MKNRTSEQLPGALLRWVSGGLLCLVLAGCATGPNANPRDPWEPFNRQVTEFNDAVDGAVLKPVATVYRDITPDPVRTGVSNFFENLRDGWSFINASLQLRPREAVENFMRFNVNTFFGLAGVLDIASEMGIERTRLDFGQTLGRWGIPSGPYLVLPIFGPSSVRDAAGFTIEARGDFVQGLSDVALRNSLYALRAVETRANLLRATTMLDGAALDKYSFTRDVYLQRRESQIEDLKDKGIGLQNGDGQHTDTK